MYIFHCVSIFTYLSAFCDTCLQSDESGKNQRNGDGLCDEIRLELVTGGGERTDALMSIIGTAEGEKETTILVLKKLSDGNANDLDFA